MKHKFFSATLPLIFCVVILSALFMAGRVSADTSMPQNTVLQKPVLAVSVQSDQIIMKVKATGATTVTINNRNEKGESIVYRPILTPEGTWFISLPVIGLAFGTYTSYAVADSGFSVFGQSNIVTYTIKASERVATSASTGSTVNNSPTSGTSTPVSGSTSTAKQPEITIKDNAITQTGTAVSGDANVASTATSQAIIEATTLPEKFSKSVSEVKSTKTVDSTNANSPIIESIENIKVADADQSSKNISEKDVIVFSGKAKPNSTIYLYIFSDPIVVSVKADENGNWQYILDRPLDTGKHESYVLIEDPDTKEVLRTEAKSFFVSKARATSSMMDIPGNKGIILEDPFTAMIRNYIVYVGIIVGMAILAVLYFGLRKYRKVEAYEDGSSAKNE